MIFVRLFLAVGFSLSDWVFDSLESLKSWVLIRVLRPGSEHGAAWHDGSVYRCGSGSAPSPGGTGREREGGVRPRERKRWGEDLLRLHPQRTAEQPQTPEDLNGLH